MERQWLPTIADLIDRLSICQLKEVFVSDMGPEYAEWMAMIRHDIDLILGQRDVKLSADLIHLIVVLSQCNLHIWQNESKARRGEEQDLKLLALTHGLNGLRQRAANKIARLVGDGREDKKVDALAADFDDWNISILREP